MYTPAVFKQDGIEEALKVITDEPFGMLVSTHHGEFLTTHLPFSIVQTQPRVVLCAHMAKANSHWRALEGEKALVVFRGVHGYISPRWYTRPSQDVPTWNYIAVHCTGVVRIAAESQKAQILGRLADQMEGASAQPWSVDMLAANYFARQAAGIVGFFVEVSNIESKFKLSQNRKPADRNGAIAALAAGDAAQRALAAAMSAFAHS